MHRPSFQNVKSLFSLHRKEARVMGVFVSKPGHRWFRNCIFHHCVRYLSRWVITFFLFSPPTPLGNGQKEDQEKSNGVVRQL